MFWASRARRQARTRWRRPGAAGSKRTPATAPLCAICTPTAPTRRETAASASNSGCPSLRWPIRALAVATSPSSRASAVATARRSRVRSRSKARTSSSSGSGTGRERVSTGAPPPRAHPTTTSGGSAGPRVSSTRPSRCANSTGRPSHISGSQASSARTASRATVSGASRTAYESATARTAAITSLVELPMPRPTGMPPVSRNSPPQGGCPDLCADSATARAAARTAFVRPAGTAVSASGGVPGRRTNSARLPGPAMGSVTRPAHRRPSVSRKTPWRISPWWQGACPLPVRITRGPRPGSGTGPSPRR